MVQECPYKFPYVWVSIPIFLDVNVDEVFMKFFRFSSLILSIFFSTGKDGTQKEYYTLECLLFFLKNISLSHPVYVRQAAVSYIGCYGLVFIHFYLTKRLFNLSFGYFLNFHRLLMILQIRLSRLTRIFKFHYFYSQISFIRL